MSNESHVNNIVVGAGELYIDLLDADDKPTGERYLGDSPGASLSVATERVQVFSGDGPVARKLVDSVRSISRSLQITLHDVSLENLALFVGGETPTQVSDEATAVVDEALTVRPGLAYQLGASKDKPAGFGAVDGAAAKTVVTNSDGSTTYTAGEDYRVDAKHARLYIVPGGDIAEGAKILVDYTPAAASRKQVRTGELKDVRAAVRYIECPTAGRGRNYYAPLCSIGPSGEMTLKSRDGAQQIQLTAEILEPEGGQPALFIDGEAA